jgi:hypothetical protein
MVDFTQYQEIQVTQNDKGKNKTCLFQLIISAMVSPSPQEQRKLLTSEGNQHHHFNMNVI